MKANPSSSLQEKWLGTLFVISEQRKRRQNAVLILQTVISKGEERGFYQPAGICAPISPERGWKSSLHYDRAWNDWEIQLVLPLIAVPKYLQSTPILVVCKCSSGFRGMIQLTCQGQPFPLQFSYRLNPGYWIWAHFLWDLIWNSENGPALHDQVGVWQNSRSWTCGSVTPHNIMVVF